MPTEVTPELTQPVARHPRIAHLGRTPREQRRVESFAKDLARYLVGGERDELGPLAKVVTAVARRELRDPRRLCENQPLLAVEAAARATEAMWPLLRGPLQEEEPPPPQEDDGDGEGDGEEGGEGEGGGEGGSEGDADGDDGEGEGDGSQGDGQDQEGDGAEQEGGQDGGESASGAGGGASDGEGEQSQPAGADPRELLEELAGQEELDQELESLAERLREALGNESADTEVADKAAEILHDVGQAATEGALESSRVARQLEHFLPGVGWSGAPQRLQMTLLEQLDKLSALLEQLDQLKELADALGRMEASSSKAGLEQGGSEEVVGVHYGGEVALALPSELGLLGDPETEDLFYQRYVEQRLISLELTGAGMGGSAQGDEKGPVIACIDTSGSMEGPPEMAAKALVLALCRRVLRRGRTVHLILFGGPNQKTEVRLRRGWGGLEGLIAFLGLAFRAGTDFDVPLMRAMELLDEQELSKADVLVVTDGLCRASADVVSHVQRVKERRGVKVWSVVLGTADAAGVRPFSDEVWQLDPTVAAETIGLLKKMDVQTRW